MEPGTALVKEEQKYLSITSRHYKRGFFNKKMGKKTKKKGDPYDPAAEAKAKCRMQQ